ncbi:hypothetical protein M3Y95_01066900 [Aphelenchoides besseyi]|nr:hypothetical protein M3Y95_01066900 [Aphelenchoides besseyi]
MSCFASVILLKVLLISFVHGCRDNHGKSIKAGVEYLDDQGLFYMKCTETNGSWKNAGVACKIESGERIEIGNQLIKDDLVHRCWLSADDSIHYDYANSKNITESKGYNDPNGKCEDTDGKIYRYGEQFVSADKNFLMLCTGDDKDYMIKAIFCLTKDGLKMNSGEYAERGDYIYNCTTSENGHGLKLLTGELEDGKPPKQPKPSVDQCFDKNKNFLNDKQFIVGQFVMSCLETADNYIISPTACIIKDGTRLEKNTEVIRGKYKHKCEPKQNGALESIRLPISQ